MDVGTVDADKWLTMGDATARTGLSAQTLRNYEDQGLIRPQRIANGMRLYTGADLSAALRTYHARAARHGLTGHRRSPVAGA